MYDTFADLYVYYDIFVFVFRNLDAVTQYSMYIYYLSFLKIMNIMILTRSGVTIAGG